MAQPVRYTFEREFDPPRRGNDGAGPAMPRVLSRAEIEAVRASAYAEGLAAGRAEARAEQEQAVAEALAAIAESVPRLTGQLEAECERLDADARSLALLVARKLAPALVKRAPAAECEALIAETLSHLPHQPHVLVRVNDRLAEEIDRRARAIAAETGFSGKLVVRGDPDVALADCRIEWADGGVVRDTAALERQIDELVQHRLQAECPAETTSAPVPAQDGPGAAAHGPDADTPAPAVARGSAPERDGPDDALANGDRS